VRRETASAYLKAAGIEVRLAGAGAASKPANEVSTDCATAESSRAGAHQARARASRTARWSRRRSGSSASSRNLSGSRRAGLHAVARDGVALLSRDCAAALR
jgi:hypothetical protein